MLESGTAFNNGSGTIEAAAGTLALKAASLDSSGSIVNAGNGALTLSSLSVNNARGATISAAGELDLQVANSLVNAGDITSAQSLHFQNTGALLTNSGRIGAGGPIDIEAAAIDNAGGQLVTVADSAAAIELHARSLDNSGGQVAAAGALQITVEGRLANGAGSLHGGAGTALDVGAVLANGSGTIESAAGQMVVRAMQIDSSGRLVSAGAGPMVITSTTGIANAGTIVANGVLTLSAETLDNTGGGTIGAGATLDLAVRDQVSNAGVLTSQGTLRFEQAGASLLNTGRLGAGAEIDIGNARISNHGQIYTVNNSGAAIHLQTGRFDNTNGVLYADGSLNVQTDDGIANDAGLLHAGTAMAITAGGALDNSRGAIELSGGAMNLAAASIENGGRIGNAGAQKTSIASINSIVNSGTLAGNGALDVHAASLQNSASGQLTAAGELQLDVHQQLNNAGTISSGAALAFDQAGAAFSNSGLISAAGDLRVRAASFDNRGGRMSTVVASGKDIAITAASLDNQGGAIVAEHNLALGIGGMVDNAQGVLHSGGDLVLSAAGALRNGAGFIESSGAGSSLTVDAASIDNGNGTVSNAGGGDTRLSSHAGIVNSGAIAGMGRVLLSATTLLNQAGAMIASGGNLTLAATDRLENHGKINSNGTLTFDQRGADFFNSGEVLSGANAILNARVVDNSGGRLGTASGSGADLAVTAQQVSNQGGRIATDRDLLINSHEFSSTGELFGGRDLAVAMDGDFTQSGAQQLRANRDLTLAIGGTLTNTSSIATAGRLILSGQQIVNTASATIGGANVIMAANGNLDNAGEINGVNTLQLIATSIGNSGAIVGGDVAVLADQVSNTGASALIGASGALGLGISASLNNTGGATLYSSGDLAIGRPGGGGTTVVNNRSSTIEAGGNLFIEAATLSNVRENVQIVQVKTVDETVHMELPSWYQFGENHHAFETGAANYRPHEVYFVDPADILEDQAYVTPDGNTIHRALIRTHANDSAFAVAASGLSTAYGAQSRLMLSDGTRVIYYTESATVANPDQGAPASNIIVGADTVTDWSSTVDFSSDYGSCSSACVRLVTQPDYNDPRTTILRDTQRALAPVKAQLEVSREAHHVAMEDQLAPGAGAVAQILSGGNMHLTVSDTFENRFSDIKARGFLTVDGVTATNVGATLYRTHSFDGTWQTYGGQTVAYQEPSQSVVAGYVTGVIDGAQGVSITARGFNNVDVTAGTVGNIRDAVNVIGSGVGGAGGAGAHVGVAGNAGGAVAGPVVAGPGAGDMTNTPVVVGAGIAATDGGQLSSSHIGAQAGSAGAIATTGNGSGIGAQAAVASGLANHARAASHVVGTGFADVIAGGVAFGGSGVGNDLVADGTVRQGSAASSERLASALKVDRNVTGRGDMDVRGGALVVRESGGPQQTAMAGMMKVTPSGLFIRNPDSSGRYLFETRPQFANQQLWASSDFLLKQLEYDPATTQKRLGDGFYEQRLVREQLAELTGHQSYSGASDDSIYSELLTNAVSAAKQFGLRPGIALSSEQVARLTSDVAWLESEPVMLADGSVEIVLVPKVYLAHVGEHSLKAGGALVTGKEVTIATLDTIVNRGGVIDGGAGRTVLLAGLDIVNQGGTIKGASMALQADRDIRNETLAVTQKYDFGQNGGSYTTLSNQGVIATSGALDIRAGRDLNDVAGKISADSAIITAGRDVNSTTLSTGSAYQSQISGYQENDSTVKHQVGQVSTVGDLKIAATRDLNLIGTQVSVGSGGSGNGQLLAGRNIQVAAVTNEINTSVQNSPANKQYDKQVHANASVAGAGVVATGNLTVSAGILESGAINVNASSVAAGEALKLTASDSINIVSAQEQHLADTASTHSSGGLLHSETKAQTDYIARSDAIGSALSGKTVNLNAGKDITVLGSAIAGEGDVNLVAAGNISIGASTSTLTEQHHTEVKESGFLSGGGFGISYGTRTTTTDQSRDATTQSGQSRSLVGSIGGTLVINAGEAVNVRGSDLTAGENMVLHGKSVTVEPGQDDLNTRFATRTMQDGLTLSLGGSVVNAIQTGQGMAAAAAQASSGRLTALAAAAAAMTAKDTVKDIAANGPSAKVSLTMGHSESASEEVNASSTHGGSLITVGKDLIISATGGGRASNIDILGSDVRAAGKIKLVADNEVNLLAAQDTESQHSKSSSSSTAFGVGIELSKKGAQFGVTASASASRGKVDGSGVTQVNSHVIAGDGLTIVSGGDTNIKGAVASGREVLADIGGNLNIESLQDSATLDGKRQSASASGTLGAGAGISANASNSTVHNDYASVREQSGIRAGDGGFQLKVGSNTDLKGGVISSTQAAIDAGRNSLTTATLSFADVQNRDASQASGISLGANVGKNQSGDTFSPSLAPGMGQVRESAGSMTVSAVSGGSVTVEKPDAAQALAGLNRDVVTGKNTTAALDKSWTGAQALDNVGAQMQITSAGMPRLAKEIGDYAEIKQAELKLQGKPEEAAKWAEGGIYRVAAHTALGAFGGGVGGAVGATAAALAAPTLDSIQNAMQGELTKAGLGNGAAGAAAKLIAASTAMVLGGAAGGGTGAAAGLNTDANNRLLHPKELKFINEKAKELTAQTCKLADLQCNMRVERYWGDLLTAEAEATVDTKLAAQRQAYLKQIAATGLVDGLQGQISGQAAEYLRNTQIARSTLEELRGAEIVGTDGKPIIADGEELTYFSGSLAQRLDHALYAVNPGSYDRRVSENSSANVIVPRQEIIARTAREQERLTMLQVVNGSAETICPECLLIGSSAGTTLKSAAEIIAKIEIKAKSLLNATNVATRSEESIVKSTGASYSASLGKQLGQHTAVDPGPLPDNIAGTFAGGRYGIIQLSQDTTLYRAGTVGQPLGQFFSTSAPTSILQTRIDQAVLPIWPGGGTSPLDTWFAVTIPAGTHVYVGEIGAQGGFYVGGAQQIVVLRPWTIPGVKVINSGKLP
ncbi:hemagglutinin repeat-containing protein [Massilia sp. PWRC2]|uniref:hemagglutinin repeat-containing protein n=1 Tax=Massilia sp. PWRC2 TaxID=2804626 RepID=UPI003CF66FF3